MSVLKDNGSSKRKSELHKTAKKVCFDKNVTEPKLPPTIQSFRLDSLPDRTIHLGGDIFTYVNNFRNLSSVHIRSFSIDEKGFFHPTKNGVSLKLRVWSELMKKLCHFDPCKKPEEVLTVQRDVSVFKHETDTDFCVSFQRMYQRKDLTFQLLPERVVLTQEQYCKLRDSHEKILKSVKNSLLTYIFRELVLTEL